MERTRQWLWQWVPVGLWLGVVILESTSWLSSQNTGQLLYSLATAVFGHIDRHKFEVFHAVLRKCGHFVGYGMLAVLIFRALRATTAGTVRQWSTVALVLTMVVAALDEWHQSFLPARSGNFHDVILDTLGGICMLALLRVVLWARERRAAVAGSY